MKQGVFFAGVFKVMVLKQNPSVLKQVRGFSIASQLWVLLMLSVTMVSAVQAEPRDFTLPGLDGVQHKLSDFRGKWVVVNYWATWCPPCLKEIPELIEFHDTHKDKDAVVIGVAFEDISSKELREFVDSYFIVYPILRQKPAARSDLGVISGLPTSFLISPDGELIAQQVGPVSAKMIEDFIKEQAVTVTKAP